MNADQHLTETPFRLFIDSVQDYAIFMLDPEGHITTWNAGAQRIKGYREREIVGQHFSVFYTREDRERNHPAHELELAAAVGRYEEEGWRVRKDGTMFWANVVITAVRNSAGELIGFGKVTRDLTQRKMQEESERKLRLEQLARAAAEASDSAKTQFLTTMSHELRTPLNAIIGYVDLLEIGVQGPLTPDQRASLERVRRSSTYLLSLINDILNVVRVAEGQVDFNLKTVSANNLLSDVEPLVAPQFTMHGVTFNRVACDPDLKVVCDPDKTRQILLNLLTNAYKFTSPGGTVEVKCAAVGDAVQITVRDNGRGIDPEKLSSVFEPFVQIDRHLNPESQQGIGLGLAISRDLARGMHGDLVAESELGVGSTFTLMLPSA